MIIDADRTIYIIKIHYNTSHITSVLLKYNKRTSSQYNNIPHTHTIFLDFFRRSFDEPDAPPDST